MLRFGHATSDNESATMIFDPNAYGAEVARILALDGNGMRLMPLVISGPSSAAAAEALRRQSAAELFPDSFSPQAALSGLWLYFSCFEESHSQSQDLASAEGSYWHGILHRQEPDPGNAGYWFRRVGRHPVFRALAEDAAVVLRSHRVPASASRDLQKEQWDPFAFIDFCESSRRQPGSSAEQAALEIQRTEWQLLFDFCARPGANRPGPGANRPGASGRHS
jgi:hypothetical protein